MSFKGIRITLQWLLVLILTCGCSSSESTRQSILNETPIGSPITTTESFCKSSQLSCKRSDTAGYLNQDTGATVGTRSIWAVVDKGAISNVVA